MLSYFVLAVMCFFFGLFYIFRKDDIILVLSHIEKERKKYIRFGETKKKRKSSVMPFVMNLTGFILLFFSAIFCITGFLMLINQTT